MKTKQKKPFIPRDKPKSWIIAILSGLGGLIIAGPLIFLGYFLEFESLKDLGMVLFVGFWLDFVLMGLLFRGNVRVRLASLYLTPL